MNMKQQRKPPLIHRIIEELEHTDAVVTACGRWLVKYLMEETAEEVTCRRCLQYLEGGLTSKEKNNQ